MVKYITEALKEISDNPTLLTTTYKGNYAVETALQYAFDKRGKFLLPEGEPPYKKDAAPIGMSQANFYQQVKKLYIFTRADLNAVRREQLFIQLLESLHPDEAKVCVAIKDQNLTSLYPGITSDVVVNAGLVEPDHCFRQSVVPNKEGGRDLVVTISDSTTAKESFGKPTDVPPVVKRGRGRPPGSKTKKKEA